MLNNVKFLSLVGFSRSRSCKGIWGAGLEINTCGRKREIKTEQTIVKLKKAPVTLSGSSTANSACQNDLSLGQNSQPLNS